jgi:hypothetical protein
MKYFRTGGEKPEKWREVEKEGRNNNTSQINLARLAKQFWNPHTMFNKYSVGRNY